MSDYPVNGEMGVVNLHQNLRKVYYNMWLYDISAKDINIYIICVILPKLEGY